MPRLCPAISASPIVPAAGCSGLSRHETLAACCPEIHRRGSCCLLASNSTHHLQASLRPVAIDGDRCTDGHSLFAPTMMSNTILLRVSLRRACSPVRCPCESHHRRRPQRRQPDNNRIGAKPPSRQASVSSNAGLRECELRLWLRSTHVNDYLLSDFCCVRFGEGKMALA